MCPQWHLAVSINLNYIIIILKMVAVILRLVAVEFGFAIVNVHLKRIPFQIMIIPILTRTLIHMHITLSWLVHGVTQDHVVDGGLDQRLVVLDDGVRRNPPRTVHLVTQGLQRLIKTLICLNCMLTGAHMLEFDLLCHQFLDFAVYQLF